MTSVSGYSFSDICCEAQTRWLKPAEVFFILQNYNNDQLTHEPPQKPPSGSLFLFNKRVLRFFRKDGHSWRRKKDGRTVGEAHERLKVGNVEAINCYYAHGDLNPNFQRRCYWLLDPAYEHIVLVHYRDISIVRNGAGSISVVSPESSSALFQSPSSCTSQFPFSSAFSNVREPYENTSSPSSAEVSSDVFTKDGGTNRLDLFGRTEETNSLPGIDISQALRRLEEQLSLDDDVKDIPFYSELENSNFSEYAIQNQSYNRSAETQYFSNSYIPQQYQGNDGSHQYQHQLNGEFTIAENGNSIWKDMYNGRSSDVASQGNYLYTLDGALPPLPKSGPEYSQSIGANDFSSVPVPEELEDLKLPQYSPPAYKYESDPYSTFFGQSQFEMSLESNSSLTIAKEQKFTIREISPEWCYDSEPTKVFIIGSFKCDPSSSDWACMFGNVEVPIDIIQDGVIRCQAPPCLPGKVTLCITSANRESCSEVREFEYRVQPNGSSHNSVPQTEASRSSEELLLLVRFAQVLLSDKLTENGEVDLVGSSKSGEDAWDQVIEALSLGNSASGKTSDWLLELLLKDKLQQWLSSRPSGALSKREQGIIHMVSGLGFTWALAPILNSGVSVNFRDANGWTALHWAARFGREKLVAELLASGASAGAVTDPNSKDPTGKTPATVAATYGHKGLAGYLSEMALTSHLSSLTMKQSELSSTSADVEAERTVNAVAEKSAAVNEDELSLKDTLAAVRNAAQAAARIQSAFRAHSFMKRQQKEAATHVYVDEYDILSSDIVGLSAASKLAFGNPRDHNAALSIQRKYRGWKGRKDFLELRQKVVKIQAHVRGHQVRKHYKVICWATGVLEKVILRWHRKGVGLRGFRQEPEPIDETEDEDIAKVFRKQKVDVAIDEALSRVLSMVDSQAARHQYRRMLEKYRQAKAERGDVENEAASSSAGEMASMENDDLYLLT